MVRIVVLAILFCLVCSVCFAAIPADKAAHFGVGYIINDQLDRHTNLTFWERIAVVAVVAYAKEKHDPVFDKRDFGATMLGALTWQIKF